MWIREEELKRVREMTIGELLDALAQDDYDDHHNREKLKNTLCPILIQARDFYAGENDVCRGALAIAATAIDADTGGFLYNYAAKRMTQYTVMLADEMLRARGVGNWPIETLVNLRKIRDTYPDVGDWEEWPEDEKVTIWPMPQPQAAELQQPQAAE